MTVPYTLQGVLVCTWLAASLACYERPKVGPDTHLPIPGPNMSWLAGSWSAEAFDGHLMEEWQPIEDGVLLKRGHYIVGPDTPYTEAARIASLTDAHYLLAKPVNGAFRLYDCERMTPDSAVFISTFFTDPFRIEYARTDKDSFVRRISSIDGSDTVVYTFRFRRMTTTHATDKEE